MHIQTNLSPHMSSTLQVFHPTLRDKLPSPPSLTQFLLLTHSALVESRPLRLPLLPPASLV